MFWRHPFQDLCLFVSFDSQTLSLQESIKSTEILTILSTGTQKIKLKGVPLFSVKINQVYQILLLLVPTISFQKCIIYSKYLPLHALFQCISNLCTNALNSSVA